MSFNKLYLNENSPARGYLNISKKFKYSLNPTIFCKDLTKGVTSNLVTLPFIDF